jgi:hypothetical protein
MCFYKSKDIQEEFYYGSDVNKIEASTLVKDNTEYDAFNLFEHLVV